MATQIDSMYVTIGGKDEITDVLKKISNSLEKVNKETGEVITKNNQNFEYLRQKFSELSTIHKRLSDQMSKGNALHLDTSQIQRDIETVERAIRGLIEVGSKGNFTSKSFASSKGIRGIKDEIDGISNTALGSARSMSQLEREIERLSKKSDMLSRDSVKEEANLAKQNKLVESLTVAYNRLGYAIRDIDRMQSKPMTSSTRTFSSDLRGRMVSYQSQVYDALKLANNGKYSKTDAVKLLGSQYIDLYDQRSQLSKDVSYENSVSARAEKIVVSWENAQVKIRSIIAGIDKDIERLETAKGFKGLGLGDTSGIRSQIANLQALKKEWESILGNKGRATDKSEMATMLNMNDATRRQADAQYKVAESKNKAREAAEVQAKVVAKEAENYDIARERIERYIGVLERLNAKLENVKNNGNVSASTSNAITSAINANNRAIADWKAQQSDMAMAMDKGIFASNLTQHASAKGTSRDLYSAALSESNRNNAEMRRAEVETRRLADAYNRAVGQANQKLGELGRIKQDVMKQQAAAMKSGADTSNLQKAREQIDALIAQYQRVKTMSRNDVLNRNGMAGTIIERLGLQMGDVRYGARNAISDSKKELSEMQSAARRAAAETEKSFEKMRSAAENTRGVFSMLKSELMQFAPIYGFQQLIMSIIEVGGEIEKQHIALRTIVGDLQDADELFGQIKVLALKSPFTFGELNKDVKQLAAFGVETKDLYDTTRRLADISSGLGVSFERIALAYGQTKSRSWLDAKELRQFAYAGIPMLQSLADMYSTQKGEEVTTADVSKMIKNREVSFEDVQKVLWDMTDESGKFFGMQNDLSETLLGRYNKLKDAWEIMESEFAKGDGVVGGTLKFILDMITSIVLGFDKAKGIVASFFAMFAARKIASGAFALFGGDQLKAAKNILGITGMISQRQVAMLVNEKLITAEKGRQMLALQRMSVQMSVLGRQLSQMRMKDAFSMLTTMFGAGGSVGGVIGGSLKALGSSILGFFGGIPGAIATTALVGWQIYKQHTDKIEETDKAIAAGIEDRHKRLERFLEDNSNALKAGADDKDVKRILKSYEDIYKELSGIQYIDFNDYGETERARNLRRELELLKDAQTEAQKYNNLFGEAADSRDAYFLPDDTFEENISKWQEVYESMQTMTEAGKNLMLGDYFNQFGDLKEDVDNMAKEVMQKLVNVSPAIRDKVYGILKESYLSSLEGVEPYTKDMLSVMFDEAAGIDASTNFASMVAKNMGSEFKNLVEKEIHSGKSIEDIARGAGNSSIKAAMEQLQKDLPSMKDTIQRYLDDNPVYMTIVAMAAGDEKTNPLQQTMLNRANNNSTINARKDFEDIESQIRTQTESGDISELREAAKNARAKAKEKLKSAKEAGFGVEEAQEAAEIADIIWNLYGFKDEKTSSTSRNRQDAQLKHYEVLLNLMKQLNSEYKKYVELYGKEGAISKLKATGDYDMLKEALGKNFDYSDYKGNASTFENWVKQHLSLTTEQRKKFWSETQKQKLDMQYDSDAKKASDELAKKMLDIEAMSRRFSSYQSMRSLGIGFAASNALLPDDESLLTKFIPGKANAFIDGGSTKTAEELEKIRKDAKEALEKLTKGTPEYEAKLNEFLDAENSLFKLKQGTDVVLDGVTSTGRAGKRVESGRISDVWKSLLENTLDLQGGRHSIDEFYAGLNPTEKSKQKLISDSKLKELFGEKSIIYEIIKLYKQAVEQENQTALEIIKSMRETDNTYRSRIAKIDAEADNKIFDLGDNAEIDSGNGMTYKEVIDADRNFKKLEATEGYYNFFNNALAMSATEIDAIGKKIKEALEDRVKAGLITAEQYTEELRKMQDVLDSMYNKNGAFGGTSDFSVFLKGGVNGLYNASKSNTNSVIAKLKEQGLTDEKIKDNQEYKDAKGAEESLKGWVNGLSTATDILAIATGVFNGLSQAASSLSEMFYALGKDSVGDTWSDINDTISGAASVLTPANNIVSSALNGDISGVVSNAISAPVQMVTGPITAFAKLHDKKQDRIINNLKLQNTILDNGFNNLKRELEDALGGLYSDSQSSAYSQLYNNKVSQLENVRQQLDAEEDKKDSDSSAIEDYKQQIEDLEYEVSTFAKDMANELYGIDFESFASNLSSALVDAWESGTNAAKAYKDTVSDIMKSVITSVVQQKVIGNMIEPIMDKFYDYFAANGGVLDDTGISMLASMISLAQDATDQTYDILNAAEQVMQSNGSTLKSSTSGLSSSISSVTEDTADMLTGYINTINMNVALTREAMEDMAATFGGEGVGNRLATIVSHLKNIEINTGNSADSLDRIESTLNSLTNGTGIKRLSVSVA